MNQVEHILTDLLFLFASGALCLANYQVFGKKIFHPAVLFTMVWFGVLLLHFVFKFTLLPELYPLSTQTYLVFFTGSVSFSLGSLAVLVPKMQAKKQLQSFTPGGATRSLSVLTITRVIFLGFALIGLPFYIQAAYRLFIASGLDNFFIGLRVQLSYGDDDIGPTKYLVSLSVVIYALNLYAYLKDSSRLNRIILNITLVVTILYAVFATGRLFFFIILSVYLGMNYIYRVGFSVRKYVLIIFLFLLFFMAYGVYYGKGGDTDDTLKNNVETASEALGVYLVSSLSAFDGQLKMHTEATQYGNNTLRFFIKIGQVVGIGTNKEVIDLKPDFVYIPYPTNVFTIYNVYVSDFGRLYAWLMLFFFGGLHTLLFNKALQTRKFRYGFYYAMMLFPLLVSFFSDMYLTILSTWIQVAFFLELVLLSDNVIKRTYGRYRNR